MFSNLLSNRSWFEFQIDTGLSGFESLGVYAFSGEERVSAAYEFEIELVSRDSNLDLTGALGKECLLRIADKSGERRLVHGVIRQMEQLHSANAFTHYRCTVVPRFWFLGQTQDQRIYQQQNVEEIIKTVLAKHNFPVGSYAFKLKNVYPKREYCVQYGESDFHFINRLCEEEGIYYYFEHKEEEHCLCFSDAEGGPAIPGESDLRFYPGSGHPADTAVISRISIRHRINSDSATHREWNFTTPSVDLTGQANEPDMARAPMPLAMRLETYKFPHVYQTRSEGERYTDVQLLRQLTFRQWIECESDGARFLPGYTFSVHEHPRADANLGWWVVAARHEGKQPQVLEHEAPEDRGLEYACKVTAIPDDTRFVPEALHPKGRIDGLQSAVVTGPGGEEVYTDEYGRVKVQFHWDRLGQHDENTTCWVRVADSWAGVNFGFIQVPRIGQEVMVEFMEGDPDRPVITGRGYNAALMPPWKLPEQKTLSGIQSREFKAGRRNQLVLDDTQGEIQAQLSSDHGLSQLNLGYLTRVNHVEGRKDFRGEGFELRTDDWGVIRAGKGLYVSTYERSAAERHLTDAGEAISALNTAAKQHKDTGTLAETCGAQEHSVDCTSLAGALGRQVEQIQGTGESNEFTAAQVVVASPEGVALTTPKSTHLHAGEHVAISSERHTSISAGRSFLVSALEKVSLFAHKMGMRLMAAHGKVEIEAQSDAMNIIADKDIQMFSANGKVHISSPSEILLTAGGSYIKIGADGIEQGTTQKWRVKASDHAFEGPNSMDWLSKSWKDGEVPMNVRVAVRDELGRYLDLNRYAKKGTEAIQEGATEHKLVLFHEKGGVDAKMALEQKEKDKGFSGLGTTLAITGEYSNEDPEEE